MKKLIFITLPILIIFLGFGCIKKTQPILNETLVQDFSKLTSDNRFDPFAGVTSTKVFSEPDADFTFEYPSFWKYYTQSVSLERIEQYPDEKTWAFYVGNTIVMYVTANPSEGISPCPISVEDQKQRGITYSTSTLHQTNDPETVILSQFCGGYSDIRWELGYHPEALEKWELPHDTVKNSIRIFQIYTKSSDSVIPTQNDKDQVDRMVRSIKIKTDYIK